MTDIVQTLNSRAWVEKAEKIYQERIAGQPQAQDDAAARAVWQLVFKMSREDRRRFLRGKLGALKRAEVGCDSRSGAYELEAAALLGVELCHMGLLDGSGKTFRDMATGGRVRTRLRELARLRWDWKDAEVQEWLRNNWAAVVASPLPVLKDWIRQRNPRAKAPLMEADGDA